MNYETKGRNLKIRAELVQENMQMYCVKCRTKRDAENVQEVTMKNGKKASKGTCPVCSTSMFRIGG